MFSVKCLRFETLNSALFILVLTIFPWLLMKVINGFSK